MARSFGSPIPRTPLPNLRVNRSLLANLARPGFSKSVGTAVEQAALAPEVRGDKKEQDRLFDEIIEASKKNDMATVGSLFQESGRLSGNLAHISQGVNISRQAARTDATLEIGNLLAEASQGQTTDERLSQINTAVTRLAQDNGLNSFEVSGQLDRALNARNADLGRRAEKMIQTGMTREDFVSRFGQANAGIFDAQNRTIMQQNESIETLTNAKLADAQSDSLLGPQEEYTRLINKLDNPSYIPTAEESDRMHELERTIFEGRQELDRINNTSTAAAFLGFTDRAFTAQRKAKRAAAEQARADEALAKEDARERAVNFILSGGDVTQGIAALRQSENFDASDEIEIMSRVKERVELREQAIDALGRVKLSAADIKFINDPENRQFFQGVVDFEDNLEIVNSKDSSRSEKRTALIKITNAVQEARKGRRDYNLRTDVLNDRIDDAYDQFVGQGNEDSPFYNPRRVFEGDYKTIANLSDDNKARLKSKMLLNLRKNPNRDTEEVLLESFQELGIRTDKKELEQQRARQAQMNEDFDLFYRAVAAEVNKTMIERGYPELGIDKNPNLTSEQFSALLANPQVQAIAARRVQDKMNPPRPGYMSYEHLAPERAYLERARSRISPMGTYTDR